MNCDTKGSPCNPSPSPVYKELSTVTYRDCDTKGSPCNPSHSPVYKELSTVTYRDCDTNGSRCSPSSSPYPNPGYKKLFTVTPRDNLALNQTTGHTGIVTQMDPAVALALSLCITTALYCDIPEL